VIDTHVHVWALDEQHQPPPDSILPPPREAAPVEWLVEEMPRFGIDHCVLVLASSFGWDNSYMVECLGRYPGLFKAIGLVDPTSATNAKDLRAWMKQGLSGFRLHPVYYDDDTIWIDRPANDALWRAAAETDAVLQFHMLPKHAVYLRRMIERHPDVRVIVDHLGKPDVTEAAPYPSFQPVLDLADYPRVWVKIGDVEVASRLPFPFPDTEPFVALLKQAFGANRMIWGTGYPTTARRIPLADALSYVHALPCLSDADRLAILETTPRALFGF